MKTNMPDTLDRELLRNLALFVPRVLRLVGRLLADSEVDTGDKVLLGAAALYVVSPLDIVPDSIPLVGPLDDLFLLTLVLLRLLNRSGDEKIRQHWSGPEDIVAFLDTVTDLATRYLPESVRSRIRAWVDAKSS
jgi:uncharacterized membrane protein YkvA (DUF1232 family)